MAAETVVLAGYRQSQNEVWAALRERVPQLHIVGDALSARDIQPAIREGHRGAVHHLSHRHALKGPDTPS